MTEYLTQQQLQRLRTIATAPRDRLLIDALYQTGCTVSELVELRREDIKERTITVHGRECHVSEELIRRIHRHLRTHNSPYLFTSRQRDRLTTKRVQQLIKKQVAQLDPSLNKKSPHILRYTHIAHALQKNIPVKAIMKQTGLRELRMSQLVQELTIASHDDYRRFFP